MISFHVMLCTFEFLCIVLCSVVSWCGVVWCGVSCRVESRGVEGGGGVGGEWKNNFCANYIFFSQTSGKKHLHLFAHI